MLKGDIEFKDWLRMSDEERKSLADSWNVYRGEGERIMREIDKRFHAFLAKKKGQVLHIPYGVYHGGEWVLAVTLPVGYRVKIPDVFLGIRVVKHYAGLSDELRQRLARCYKNNIARFVGDELDTFAKSFNFVHAPQARKWLIKFVRDAMKRDAD